MSTATQLDMRLTPAAEAFIRRFRRFAAGPEAGFRLKVERGGCSGFATEFDLAAGPKADDCVWEYEGLRIFLSPESRKFMDGATVDFRESLSQTGFVITTPAGTPVPCGSASNLVSVESLVRR